MDGDFAFVLYNGEIRHYQMEEGREIPDPVYSEVLHSVICRRAREKSLFLLKNTGKTESEIRRKLKSGLYPDIAIEEAVSFLKEYHYLDDREYARNYVELYRDRKSRAELISSLLKKGIDKGTAAEFCDRLNQDSSSQIVKLLEKRRYHPDSADLKEKQKHISYLMRKGYSYEEIRSAMGMIGEDGYSL